MDHKTLHQKSIEVIKQYQSEWGAYIASPNFANYSYSWMRDGSYIAVAMDHAGQHKSSRQFHLWVNSVVKRYRHKINEIKIALSQGKTLQDHNFLFTRYSLEGYEDLSDESWGNFQYDGYGSWLWALGEYYRLTQDKALVEEVWPSVIDVVNYLSLVWHLPSYDSWEEFPELLHPYSLACVFGGFQTVQYLSEVCDLPADNKTVESDAQKIKAFVLRNAVCEGSLVKHISTNGGRKPPLDCCVDSNLLGVMVPNRLIEIDSAIGKRTLAGIHQDLVSPQGGVYRYQGDTYYGGGTWVLLTAWLGWAELEQGHYELAQARLDWIASKVDAQGWLPEQFTDEILHDSMKQPWLDKWGPVAKPLLWSHAMYLILHEALNQAKEGKHIG